MKTLTAPGIVLILGGYQFPKNQRKHDFWPKHSVAQDGPGEITGASGQTHIYWYFTLKDGSHWLYITSLSGTLAEIEAFNDAMQLGGVLAAFSGFTGEWFNAVVRPLIAFKIPPDAQEDWILSH